MDKTYTLRPLASGYGDAGASYSRRALKAFTERSGSPHEDIDDNNYTLRQRGRMLYMAAPIATSAIRTTTTNVVGVGLTLKSHVDRDALGMSTEEARDWQRAAEREFALWANDRQSCDALGLCGFAAMQQLAIASALMSGDCFALITRGNVTQRSPYSLRLRLVEADLVSTPTDAGTLPGASTEGRAENGNPIYDGVEVAKDTGEVVAYHIANRYPYEVLRFGEETKWQRVEARGRRTGMPNVLHIMDPERIGQYRGVTYLAPVIEPLLQLRRYTEAQLSAALVQSLFTAWIKTEADPATIPVNEVDPNAPPERSENEYGMGAGTVIHLRPGEDVIFGNPNIPTTGFGDFVNAVTMQVGAALELPKEVLLKSFTSNYSSSRGALLEAYRFFKKKRSWLANSFCRPVYEAVISEAVARGRLKAPGFFADPAVRAAYCGSEWVGPAQSQIDPLKEVKAAILSTHEGFTTHEQSTVEMGGGSWSDNMDQLEIERERLGETGTNAQAIAQEPDDPADE